MTYIWPLMTNTLIQMALLIACGAFWREIRPGGFSAEHVRSVLTTAVYYLFLPAMIIDVLWRSTIGLNSLQYTAIGITCIVVTILMMWFWGHVAKIERRKQGAMILSATFANVTYLGLPVLEQTFGGWARSVAIQMDLFALAPVLFTVGIGLARHYGTDTLQHKSILSFLNAPPFWAAFIAVLLNINEVAIPTWLAGTLGKLSATVVPLMLFSLGLALSFSSITWKNIPFLLPVVIVKMILVPLLAWWLSRWLTLDDNYKAAIVMEMAMPSMVIGVVFCDRYQLDSEFYAMTVTVTTLLSLVTLQIWYNVLVHHTIYLH